MANSRLNYWWNLLKLWRGDSQLNPLVVTYLLTTNCNLNCTYCEDFGARFNRPGNAATWEEITATLRTARAATDTLVLTGGEPFTHPQIREVLAYARKELKFKHITVFSNAYLLNQFQDTLPLIDQLVISLDSTSPEKWHKMIGVPLEAAKKIQNNIRENAKLQKKHHFNMVLNCVLTPETLDDAREVLKFATGHNLYVSFSPQAVHNWPHYDLLVSQPYKDFIHELIKQKKAGAPILGSMAYLNTLIDFQEYRCYPTLAPRLMPHGEMIYPCRPIEKEDDSFGGRMHLVDSNGWGKTIQLLEDQYGVPPISCTSCFQQCYIEPSLMQANPLKYLYEILRFAPSRRGRLSRFTPG